MTMKEAYQEKLYHQMEEWKAEIKILKAKALKLNADAKIKAEKELESLEKKQEIASVKLGEMKESGEDLLEQTKAGLELVWDDLKNGMESIKKHFV